ncbi:hypothetical protein [Acidovorax sp. Leaf160]|uniref:hypothetical protein n=1 Tax=Acidovorax sp. Leaf160 TaxID=1736280 RepID=UPI0006F3C80F|nr:hypothetical protein [Acidovorax sp. Leaf160]KQR55263.1 hypothetical protein ASF94_02020 [Acidovorax sp. Leaf160]
MSPIPTTAADQPPPAEAAPHDVGALPTAQGLRQLLRAALPDKSRQTAPGWFGDTDFLLTRAHVDEDGDTYHDGLFLTVWQQWDFWIADALPPVHTSLLQAAAARVGCWLRRRTPPPVGFTQLYRRHQPGADPADGAWQAFDAAADEGPPEAIAACLGAWQGVVEYWRKGAAERRARYPLRRQLLACCTPERIEALTLLPAFMPAAPGSPWAPRIGGWQVWRSISTRPPGDAGGGRKTSGATGAALRLTGPRVPADGLSEDADPACRPVAARGAHPSGDEDDGDGDGDGAALACYQIEVQRDPLGHGEAGVEISYAQRLSDTREPLPPEAVDHIERLMRWLDAAEHALVSACPPSEHTADAFQWLDAAAAHPAHAADEAVLPPVWMALSHAWQTAGRARAAAQRRSTEAQAPGAPTALFPPAPDPRALHAPRVLQLAREISRRHDAPTAVRFHRRFAFALACHADRSRADGLAVGPVGWLPDGSVVARVGGRAAPWFRLERGALLCEPLGVEGGEGLNLDLDPDLEGGVARPSGSAEAPGTAAWIDGLVVEGDASGVLWGRDAAGRVLWRHPVGTCPVRGVALSPDGRQVVVGTAGGDLVVLRKAGGGDPFGTGDSRYVEGWRGLFWEGEEGVIWW